MAQWDKWLIGCVESPICRSAVVFVDGACSSNGQSNSRAGIGVYFGPGSPYNISEVLSLPGGVTSQKAELHAVARALETVRSRVIRAHQEMCQAFGDNPFGARNTTRLRLIITTDSSYVVESMCRHYSTWTLDEKTGLLWNKRGVAIKNSDAFQLVKGEVEALSMVGVQVAYYHVRREHNMLADDLARRAIGSVA